MKLIYTGQMPDGSVRTYKGEYIPFVKDAPVEIPSAEALDLLQSGNWQQADGAEQETTNP